MDEGEGEKLSTLTNVQAKVSKVHVDGIARTKSALMLRMVAPVFKNIHNFQDLLFECDQVRSKLTQLGIFSQVKLIVDIDPDDDTAYEVTYKVAEQNVHGGIDTQYEKKGTSVVLKSAIPNLTGRAEKLTGEYHLGSKHTSEINFGLKVPLLPWTSHDPTFATTFFHGSSDKSSSAFRQIDRGLLVDLSFYSMPSLLHSLRWEGRWRELTVLKSNTPFLIREEFGHSLKSSLYHTMIFQKSDPLIRGNHAVKIDQEYAGVGGNVGFLKNELSIQSLLFRYAGIALHSYINFGILKGTKGDRISIADRYFIGGPSTVRGFHEDGVGPHSEGHALGANRFWIAGLHLDTPLPFIKNSRLSDWFKTQIFVNAGNIGEFAYNGDIYKYFNSLLNRSRVSTGFGVVFAFNAIVRLELNYCIPLLFQPGDRPVNGLQFGVGINYAAS